jgi:hypothetical protein
LSTFYVFDKERAGARGVQVAAHGGCGPNLAARLQGVAEPNAVVIADSSVAQPLKTMKTIVYVIDFLSRISYSSALTQIG